MERKKCQICDGPIVNGRCKLCGMPYRNDEVLYHLNETRSDHYKHAGQRARVIMDSYGLPEEENAAHQTGKETAAGSGKAAQRTAAGSEKAAQRTAAGSGKAAQRTGAGRIVAIILLLVILGGNSVFEKFQEMTDSQQTFEESAELPVSGEEEAYVLWKGERLEVDEAFPEGDYIFYCPDGKLTVRITNGEKIVSFFVEEGEQTDVELRQGDVVALVKTESEDQELWIIEKDR